MMWALVSAIRALISIVSSSSGDIMNSACAAAAIDLSARRAKGSWLLKHAVPSQDLRHSCGRANAINPVSRASGIDTTMSCLSGGSSQIMQSMKIVRRFPFQCMTSSALTVSVDVTYLPSANLVTTVCCRLIKFNSVTNDSLMTEMGRHMVSIPNLHRRVSVPLTRWPIP